MTKLLLPISILAGIVLGVVGIACLFVSDRMFETGEGVYVTVGHRTIELADHSIGDLNTGRAEWGILGLSCLAAAASLVTVARVRDRALRPLAIAALELSLASASLFAFRVL